MTGLPQDSSKDHGDSPTGSSTSWWSMFSSSPSSLKERVREFEDRQRIERLSACQNLDRILRDCRKRHGKDANEKHPSDDDNKDDPIESVSIGLRNMKYFGWRGILKSQEIDEGEKDEPEDTGKLSAVLHTNIRSSCAREQHAVWACRAVATGCGKDLSDLKRCFEDVDSSDKRAGFPPNIRVLTTPYTNYEGVADQLEERTPSGPSLKERIPCHAIQRQLGSCVTASGKELLERKQHREQQTR